MQQAYTREELLALYTRDVIPTRAVRKAIFGHQLWLPAYARGNLQRRLSRWSSSRSRQPVFTSAQPTARNRRSPRTSLRFGLLNAQSVGNKYTDISRTVDDGEYDVLLLTETWHTASTDAALVRCAPAGYSIVDEPRPSRKTTTTNHGGVAAIINDDVTYRPLSAPFKPRTFESTCFSVTCSAVTVVVLLLYRPGSDDVTNDFFTELVKYLESLAMYKCQIIIAGDFNVHMEAARDPDAKRLQDILDSFRCTQHTPLAPTHKKGGTLDLVVTKSDQALEELQVDPPGILSDHSLISWHLPIQRQPPIVQQREVRSWAKVDREEFRAALLSSELCCPDQRPDAAEDYFEMYHRVLQTLADRFAPVRKIKVRRQRLALWMDEECRRQRRLSRKLERRYRRTQSPEDRQAWVDQERVRHQINRQKECAYWSAEIMLQAGQSKKLWRTFNSILGRDRAGTLPKSCPSAQQFLDFFNEKVAAVRRSTTGGAAQSSLPPAVETFDIFEPCSADEVRRTIMSAPSKSCPLDPLPTGVLKEFLPELVPFLTDLCNASLLQGCLPTSQRHAIILPRLKKANADPTDTKNYRPISNLTFMSKVVERLVCHQLTAFLDRHSLLPSQQSAYRRHHSTETAVLKIVSDILLAADRGEVTLLGLLDMSAAFDTVDHEVLLGRLQTSFGVRGTVLTWIESFIRGRTQEVVVEGQQSTTSVVVCGVPQGSVLGPILFLLYTADVTAIVARHGLRAHSYADDTDIYFHAEAGSCLAQLSNVAVCIDDINQWMSSNRLKLNAEKTQFTWLGTAQQLAKLNTSRITLGSVDIQVSENVTCLGVVIDREVTFAEHIKRLAGKCFYQLRQLRTVRRTLSVDAAKTLVHAFITSRVDYCNSVLHGVSAIHLRPLQSVLNAAARLIAGKRKYDPITEIISRDLHWLPVQQRIQYKLCVLVNKCRHRTAPSYLTELCTDVSAMPGRRHLRSAAQNNMDVPRTRRTRYGPRSFSVSGPTVWNSLPMTVRDSELTVGNFCNKLKTELFRRAYGHIN
jgi:exonuclease III